MLARHEVIRRLRTAAVTAVIVAGAVGLVRYLMPRKFSAEVTLASIGPNRSGLGALSGSLGLLGAAQGGITASPAMVRSLLQSRRVAEDVATQVYGHVLSERDLNEFRRLINADVNRETGLIQVTLAHRDSALARAACLALITEVTAAFTEISRAQGREQRGALESRVDSAARQLSRAEQSLQAFMASNRIVGSFSERALEQSRRQRTMQMAQGVYQQAVTERDAAIAHELDEAPAVVVVDPLPNRLPLAPQHTVVLAALAGIATFCVILLCFAVRDQLALQPEHAL